MKPLAIVVFGATGDLARRKLFPALARLYDAKRLPESFSIVGFGRKMLSSEQFRSLFSSSPDFVSRISYVQGDYDAPDAYERLSDVVPDGANVLFYLSTPPEVYGAIVSNLKSTGLSNDSAGWRRVVIEKPFGSDASSARELNKTLREAFREEQIFRIDHYLAKHSVQNLLSLRKPHEPRWNKESIDHVQITVSEHLGVEKRAGYYDGTGALRDMVQSHILQVLALVAMETPAEESAEHVRREKVNVLKSLHFPEGHKNNVVRGRYGEGRIKGAAVPAYLTEEGIGKESMTETFVAMKLGLNHPRWQGVPFYVRTGKRLPERFADVTVFFKDNSEPFTILINPREKNEEAEAHDVLLPHVFEGNSALFPSWDEIEHSWAFVDQIIKHWNDSSEHPEYPAGSWGPVEAHELINRDGRSWKN